MSICEHMKAIFSYFPHKKSFSSETAHTYIYRHTHRHKHLASITREARELWSTHCATGSVGLGITLLNQLIPDWVGMVPIETRLDLSRWDTVTIASGLILVRDVQVNSQIFWNQFIHGLGRILGQPGLA